MTYKGISGFTLLTRVVVPLTYEVINHPAAWTSPFLRDIKETYEETNKYLGRNDFIEDADQSSESLQIPLGRTQIETVDNTISTVNHVTKTRTWMMSEGSQEGLFLGKAFGVATPSANAPKSTTCRASA